MNKLNKINKNTIIFGERSTYQSFIIDNRKFTFRILKNNTRQLY